MLVGTARRGALANSANELQSLALLGDAGGWGNRATGLEVVGPLMLIAPNGTKVSAQGTSYMGPAMNYSKGVFLLDARYEAFTTAGETILHDDTYPNHCRVLFPSTTHRIRLLFNGGGIARWATPHHA